MKKVPELLHKLKTLHTKIYILRVRKMELRWFLGINFYFTNSKLWIQSVKIRLKILLATTLYVPKLCHGLETHKRSNLSTQFFLHVVDSWSRGKISNYLWHQVVNVLKKYSVTSTKIDSYFWLENSESCNGER